MNPNSIILDEPAFVGRVQVRKDVEVATCLTMCPQCIPKKKHVLGGWVFENLEGMSVFNAKGISQITIV
jgi:hypothetical protein